MLRTFLFRFKLAIVKMLAKDTEVLLIANAPECRVNHQRFLLFSRKYQTLKYKEQNGCFFNIAGPDSGVEVRYTEQDYVYKIFYMWKKHLNIRFDFMGTSADIGATL